MTVSSGLLALAEDLNRHVPVPVGCERIEEERFTVWVGSRAGAVFNVVFRLRLTPASVEDAVAEVRALLAERGRAASTWEVGPSASPPGLVERLIELGMRPFEEPLATGMVLTEAPLVAAGDVSVRAVSTLGDYRTARELLSRGFGSGGEIDEELLAAEFDEQRRLGVRRTYLALTAGEPIAAAGAIFTPHGAVLAGGATLPEHRGHGAYRALVAARWADAVAAGTPALVVQAGAMSRPILANLGFRAVCEVAILEDGEA